MVVYDEGLWLGSINESHIRSRHGWLLVLQRFHYLSLGFDLSSQDAKLLVQDLGFLNLVFLRNVTITKSDGDLCWLHR